MLRLFLLRHAKSSWKQTGLADFDRPLSGRGERAAPLVGRYMRDKGYIPDLVLCSTSVRTRETARLVFAQLETPPGIEYLDRLYDAGPGVITRTLENLGKGPRTVMVIGHNPSIEETALALVRDNGGEGCDRLALKYPTGALTVIDFDVEIWDGISRQEGRLHEFVIPRGLDS